MTKRLIALALVILMVLPMIVACGDDKKPANTVAPNGAGGVEESLTPEDTAVLGLGRLRVWKLDL